MQRTSGRKEILVGLIDGPIGIDLPELAGENIREIPGKLRGTCALASSAACRHGTFVAGILAARRGSAAPAICPDCTFLLRPIFSETVPRNGLMPSATPQEAAAAMVDCIDSGARVINLSAALVQASVKQEKELRQALDYAALRRVIVVAAAGNQGTVGSTTITRHPWVIPVVACDLRGRPVGQSNLGNSIGRQGLTAPGENITSLGTDGKPLSFGGTSAAAPFVTGAIALLWSEVPSATATDLKLALAQAHAERRGTVVPPLLDAWGTYQKLASPRP
jgi:subtilisin family serine protease